MIGSVRKLQTIVTALRARFSWRRLMDIGTTIFITVAVLLLLTGFMLPLFRRSSANVEPDPYKDEAREKAYRRGLMIGGLMETMHDTQPGDQQRLIEQVMIEETIIEHLDHNHRQ
jgi:hypothetical protein